MATQGPTVSLTECPACGKPLSSEAVTCPNCGHPTPKPKPQRKKGGCGSVVVLCIVIIIVVGIIYGSSHDAGRPKYDPANPLTITAIIGSSDAGATASLANGVLTLTYSIDPWLLTVSTAKSTMLSFARTFFEQAFLPEQVRYACIVATGTFKDVRGNTSQGRVGNLCMNRANALLTNWSNVASSDIPKFADRAYMHPSFDTP